MIIRGIISDKELQKIKDAVKHHGLIVNQSDSFQLWLESGVYWIEVDVNQDVMSYLIQSGFFEHEGINN